MRRANICKYLLATTIAGSLSTAALAQDVLNDYEKKTFDSPEGWAMAHTLTSALNLGLAPAQDLGLWRWRITAQISSIPHLSRDEQRVGFGGFKLEDMNKSPVFGRGVVALGLPAGFTGELSWTPPVEIDGAKPENLFGVALERAIVQVGPWQVGGRVYALRGDGTGDTTCSEQVAGFAPGSVDNPFGCIAPSDDRIRMDQEGMELMLSRRSANGRWQPFIAYADTRMHPYVRINAQVFSSIDRSELEAEGNTQTYSLGTTYQASAGWRLSAALSYTPLNVRRPPLRETGNGDFWSVRIALAWQPRS
jgi:hypothetical protein